MAVSQIAQQMAQEETKLDMTPMIDVTFNLLIFFMCTLHFKTAEGMLASYLPKDQGVFSVPAKNNPQEPIHIKLLMKTGQNTEIWVGDSHFVGEKKFDSLYHWLNNYMNRMPSGRDSSTPIIIDPEIKVTFQDVISTLNACRKVQSQQSDKNIEIKFSAKALSEEE